MDKYAYYVNYNATQIGANANDECDDYTGNDSDSSSEFNSQSAENCTLIRNVTTNKADLMYRRISNYMGDSRMCVEFANIRLFSSHKSQRQHKYLKRFLFLFGFASALLVLSQLYLTNYFNGSLFEMSLSGWDRNRSRSIPFYILPDENTTITEPSELCKENSPILLLIVICSAAKKFDIRQTLRETWANTTEFNYAKFSTIHSNFKGKYLSINYPDWKNYTIKTNEINRTESSKNPYENMVDGDFQESSHADFRIRIVFLIGQTENNETQDRIMEEARMHNDVIQESFLDTYNNLTLKSVMMLKWIHNNCVGKVKFIMKCDDDTFVNVPNLVHFLLGGTIPVYKATFSRYNDRTMRTLSSDNRLKRYDKLLIGARFCFSKPVKNVQSKWYTPSYMYHKSLYPKYLSGGGYVFTMDTAERLYNASLEVPLLHLEDVYLTGICAEREGIEPLNHHLFNYVRYKRLCEPRGMVILHGVKSHDMKKTYDYVMDSNVICGAPSANVTPRHEKKTNVCN